MDFTGKPDAKFAGQLALGNHRTFCEGTFLIATIPAKFTKRFDKKQHRRWFNGLSTLHNRNRQQRE